MYLNTKPQIALPRADSAPPRPEPDLGGGDGSDNDDGNNEGGNGGGGNDNAVQEQPEAPALDQEYESSAMRLREIQYQSPSRILRNAFDLGNLRPEDRVEKCAGPKHAPLLDEPDNSPRCLTEEPLSTHCGNTLNEPLLGDLAIPVSQQ